MTALHPGVHEDERLSWEAARLTDEQLQEAADEALERPSDAAFWDERLYTTHAPVYSWADRSDDVLNESNFHAFVEILSPFAEDEEDVFTGSVGHWAVGSLQQIYVRVYDEAGDFTPAFREAVATAYALREYPVLDDEDYSRREWEEFERVLGDAVDYAMRGEDWAATEEEIRSHVWESVSEQGCWYRADDVDYDEVEVLVREADALKRTNPEALKYARHMPGQTTLSVA